MKWTPVHKTTKHGGVVGNVRSIHRGCVEDAGNELEVRLALLDCAVGLCGCNVELAESVYPLGFVGKPSRCSGLVVVDLRSVSFGKKRSAIF
eukprot:6197285-Pleurochrysis_carterae.AAC.3